ncbi:MAG: hypothetical protein QM775_23855 [Pirellulales bacterium]
MSTKFIFRAANARANSAPMPEEAPVTNAVRSEYANILSPRLVADRKRCPSSTLASMAVTLGCRNLTWAVPSEAPSLSRR